MLSQLRDPASLLYSIFSFLGFFLSIIPLLWHLHVWNVGVSAYMIWTGLACLNGFVNSLVWNGNMVNRAPVWCDISSKLIVGVHVGIPAAIACISRRLYCFTSTRPVSTCPYKWRIVIIDLCISVGLPTLVMILHCIVQGGRFDILEDVGCYPVVTNTLPAYLIYFMWPVLLGLVSLIYSATTLSVFWTHRAAFSQFISSISAMSVSLYLRLLTLAIAQAAQAVSLGVYTIDQKAVSKGLSAWVFWETSQINLSSIRFFAAAVWRAQRDVKIAVDITRWGPVAAALLGFGLLGFASEARQKYSKFFCKVPGMRQLGVARNPKAIKTPFPSWIKPLKLRDNANPNANLPPRYSRHSTDTFTINEPYNETIQSIELEELGYRDPSYQHHSPLPRRPKLRPSLFDHSPPKRKSTSALSSISSPSSSSSLDLTIIETEASSPAPPRSKPSEGSLRTMAISDRFYLLSGTHRAGSVSPAPFADVIHGISSHRRTIDQSSTFDNLEHISRDGAPSLALPSPTPPPFLNGVFITVHTESNISQ